MTSLDPCKTLILQLLKTYHLMEPPKSNNQEIKTIKKLAPELLENKSLFQLSTLTTNIWNDHNKTLLLKNNDDENIWSEIAEDHYQSYRKKFLMNINTKRNRNSFTHLISMIKVNKEYLK